jgi:hypothetical protein
LHGLNTGTTTTDNGAQESESIREFQCPCGECLLETYLQDGCPKSRIPYLGITTLSEEDKETLKFLLKEDTQKIINSFTKLSNKTCDSLIQQEKEKRLTVDKLIRVAVSFDPSLRDELKELNSIDQVFTNLTPNMSFFNHKVLEGIIETLGDEDNKKNLAGYLKEFVEFCKRKVFEVEPGLCTCGRSLSKIKGRKPFAVVLPIGKNTIRKLEDAVNIKDTLIKDLGVPPATLHLHRIDEGSIILVFSVPDSIAEKLFPLSKEKIALLRVKGMILFIPKDLKSETSQVCLFRPFFTSRNNNIVYILYRWKM